MSILNKPIDASKFRPQLGHVHASRLVMLNPVTSMTLFDVGVIDPVPKDIEEYPEPYATPFEPSRGFVVSTPEKLMRTPSKTPVVPEAVKI